MEGGRKTSKVRRKVEDRDNGETEGGRREEDVIPEGLTRPNFRPGKFQ